MKNNINFKLPISDLTYQISNALVRSYDRMVYWFLYYRIHIDTYVLFNYLIPILLPPSQYHTWTYFIFCDLIYTINSKDIIYFMLHWFFKLVMKLDIQTNYYKFTKSTTIIYYWFTQLDSRINNLYLSI